MSHPPAANYDNGLVSFPGCGDGAYDFHVNMSVSKGNAIPFPNASPVAPQVTRYMCAMYWHSCGKGLHLASSNGQLVLAYMSADWVQKASFNSSTLLQKSDWQQAIKLNLPDASCLSQTLLYATL